MSEDPKPVEPAKPGYKTTEFWLSTLAAVVGAVMAFVPNDSKVMQILGIVAMILSALGYTVVRGGIKKAAQVIVFVLLPLGLLGGCHTGEIRADAIHGSVQIICDRHDAMIDGKLDPKTISEADKATYKRSTELLRKVVNEARQ